MSLNQPDNITTKFKDTKVDSTTVTKLHYILSKNVNKNILMTAYEYHGLVASLLRFGVIFWDNCSERNNI